MPNTRTFSQVSLADISLVGGKVASLGEMIQHVSKRGINIPDGFAVTARAYHQFLTDNHLDKKITHLIDQLDISDLSQLKKTSKQIKRWITQAPFSKTLEKSIIAAYKKLQNGKRYKVAVRSSATAEDLPTASFAGQHDSFLHVSGQANVLLAVKKVFASLFNERAITYRKHHGFSEHQTAMAAGVQLMVPSDNSISGVLFTLDPESGFDQVILINAAYGLGEGVVSGQINPDELTLFKHSLNHKQAVIKRKIGNKQHKVVLRENKIQTVSVKSNLQNKFCLSDQLAIKLAKQAMIIEHHYGVAMDIEWAQDQNNKKLYIVQARPETVKSQQSKLILTQYVLQEKGNVITIGRSVGQGIGAGKANIIKSIKDIGKFKAGNILVTDMTDPNWEPIMKQAAAIVTNRGGRTCHAAIVARELGIPAIVGCTDATTKIKAGVNITASCAEGETGYIYHGILKYEVKTVSLKKMPKLPFKISMNLGNPDKAFQYQAIPNDGIGLARIEFIIGNTIGIHPNALLDFNKLPRKLKQKIAKLTAAYASPTEFYIEKLREGMSTIAAAFFPKPVIFRFSDFKSNEYANLIGGHQYEPVEENPMLGYRGTSRYVSDAFKDCFALECEAIKRMRHDMGLHNTHVMLPFTRTVSEAKSALQLMKKLGLKRSKAGLKVYMMCEIPSNALLADEFLQYFDGFSIGSNDLTQLTLGLDRDSELVADLFDERNAAVKELLHQAIQACRKQNKYVGICGQGPSDHPDLAKWLMQEGISAISLTPDSIIKTWLYLARISHNGL